MSKNFYSSKFYAAWNYASGFFRRTGLEPSQPTIHYHSLRGTQLTPHEIDGASNESHVIRGTQQQPITIEGSI